MDDDDPIGGGTLVMAPQGPHPSDPERPGSTAGSVGPRPAQLISPIALPGEPDRRLPRPPIFQIQAIKDEDTSVDEAVTRLKQDSASGVLRNLHPAFAQTQLEPYAPSPSLGPQASQDLAQLEPALTTSRTMVLAPIAIGAAAGLLVTVVVVGVVLLVRDPVPVASVRSASAPSSSELASRATVLVVDPKPTAVSPAPLGSTVPVATTDADTKARAALEKMKKGIEYCVKSTIHVLPGASPAVPSSIAWLKTGPYESLKRDWASPFFSCTRFKLEEPMPFMLQWQVDEPNVKGTGVVWLDPNGDGVIDRAYAFKATLVKRDKVEFGPVEEIDVARKVQKAR